MHHCHIQFYFAGQKCKVFSVIKKMSPLKYFTHEFSESNIPDTTLVSQADVILANLENADTEEVLATLLTCKHKETELILLVKKDQFKFVTDVLSEIKDIWTLPMSDEETKFRFLRWQQTCKMSKDFWQTSCYLESTINNISSLTQYQNKKRHADDKEMIEKTQTLEKIFTTIDCGVMRHTLDGKILSINRAALEILGYDSKEELVTDGFNMVAQSVVDEDKPKLREYILKLKKENDSVSTEYRVQHKNGDILHVLGNIKLLRENGKLIYQRFLLDWTDRKLQEKKKEKLQNELFQALSIDFSLVCFFDLDTGMGFQFQSDNSDSTFDSIFNSKISLEESMELYIKKFVHIDDRAMLRQASSADILKKELTEKKTHHINFRIYADDIIKYFQIKIVRTGDWSISHGIVMGFHSVDSQIRNELEQKHILEDALLQANQASKAKSDFLSHMSHDIRTPMNAIVGFTSLAITHIDNIKQVEKYLKKIMTSGNHLLSLINDVLDMSRIESGKMHLNEKLCSLPDILHGLQNILQPDIHAKNLELYIDAINVIDEDIYCDKLRLNQVLLNLVSNAIKYTNAGGTISFLIIEKDDAPIGYANYEFLIKDTGIGMSEEFVSHIFEPFEREKNTTMSGIQGTGLGMAITKNIVDMMNGYIGVKSKQGIGTEFKVSFTFRLKAQDKKKHGVPQFVGYKALIINNDMNACDNISYMLQQLGICAEQALSGEEAVLRIHQSCIHENRYNLYIIDWQLNDMDALEIANIIRQEIEDSTSVIIITTYDLPDIEAKTKNASITAFCSKPLFFSELINCLNTIANTGKETTKDSDTCTKHIRTGRILLAEDNELNQEIAVAILEEAGFNTEVASNGQMAVSMLEKAGAGYYRLVLMDIQMPVMNGYEATKAIRKLKDEELASIPVIAMTANAFEEDKQNALNSGMNGHIAKPIDTKNLFATLDKILA